jgi:hypothetical protein
LLFVAWLAVRFLDGTLDSSAIIFRLLKENTIFQQRSAEKVPHRRLESESVNGSALYQRACSLSGFLRL